MHSSSSLVPTQKTYLSDLPSDYQSLMKTVYQHVPYGHIDAINVRDGQIVTDIPITISELVKLPRSKNDIRSRKLSPLSLLKKNWVQLFEDLSKMESACVHDLTFEHGLPVKYTLRKLINLASSREQKDPGLVLLSNHVNL